MPHPASHDYPVIFKDGADANGIASVVSTPGTQNLEAFPARVKLARGLTHPVTALRVIALLSVVS